MPIPFEKLCQSLTDSGILSAETLQAVQQKLPAEKQRDSEALARELHRQKKLTRYQVQEAYEGRAPQLVLGNYVILDKIGQGGMGQVYKARHRRMDRIVALKMLPAAVSSNAAALARFEREVKAASKLMHPNIVAAFDADQAGGVYFLVMEYVEGSDLSAVIKKGGPLPVETAVDCIQQAARGLEFAHKKGVVHRDIKPANLLLDADGTVKVLDMGLARLDSTLSDPTAPQADLTASGMIMGTVDYMAPEQALNTRQADARSDVYSLGCTLFYLLTGEQAYGGDTLMERLLAHREQPLPDLCAIRNDVPQSINSLLARMIAKKPDQRIESMTAVIAELDKVRGQTTEILSQSGINAVPANSSASPSATIPAVPLPTPTQPLLHRLLSPLNIGIAAAVVVLMVLGIWATSGKRDPKIADTKVQSTDPASDAKQASVAKPNKPQKSTTSPAVRVAASKPGDQPDDSEEDPITKAFGKAALVTEKGKDSEKPQKEMTGTVEVATATKSDSRSLPVKIDKSPSPIPTTPPKPETVGSLPVLAGVRVDLLQFYEANPGELNTNWQIQNATLLPADGGDKEASLPIPFVTPDAYEVRLRVEPLNYRSTFELDLLQKGTRFGYQLNCGNNTSGLKTPRGLYYDASEGLTVELPRSQQGRPMSIVCQVRPQDVLIKLNGKRVADWRGPSPANPRKSADTTRLALHTGWGGFRILSAELVPLTTDQKPVPDRAAVDAVRAKVNELIGEAAPDAVQSELRELAARLHNHASAVNIDDELRYALLTVAIETAESADDLPRLVNVIEDLARCFKVDAISQLQHALNEISSRVRSAKERRDLLIGFLESYDSEIEAEHFEVALLVISTAESLVGKGTEPDLKAEVRVRAQEVEEWRKSWSTAHAARTELIAKPNDADANLAVGQYLAQPRNDWVVAVKHLAKAGDPAIQAAAQRDMTASNDPTGGAADAGIAWLDVAEKARMPVKIAYFERARHWLAQGTLATKGPALVKLQNRFKKIEAEAKKLAGSAYFKRHPLHAVAFNGHWYQFLPMPLRWDEARQYCQDEGGYLTCLETPVETQWVHQFAVSQFGSPKEFSLWLGGMSPAGAQNFIWVTGAPVQNPVSLPKRSGKPDGVEYLAARRDTAGTAQFKWASYYQQQNFPFICEWDR